MLSRASYSQHHLPSIALSSSSSSSAFTSFRFSFNLLPLSFSSLPSSKHPLNLHFESLRFSTSSSICAGKITPTRCFSRNSFIPSSSFSVPTLSGCFSSAPTMVGRPSFKAFSTGSSSGGGREILVQHLLVKENDLNLLVELQKRIAEGEDLSDLALEYSLCPSKEEGGVLGWVRKGQMVPEFEEAAFSAPLDTIVRCKTKFGWHLLQVLSEREELLLGEVQPNELHEKLQDPSFLEDAQLIDVREPEEVLFAGAGDGIEALEAILMDDFREIHSWESGLNTFNICYHITISPQAFKYAVSWQLYNTVLGFLHSDSASYW